MRYVPPNPDSRIEGIIVLALFGAVLLAVVGRAIWKRMKR